jgi:hypothetical protein
MSSAEESAQMCIYRRKKINCEIAHRPNKVKPIQDGMKHDQENISICAGVRFIKVLTILQINE